MKPIRFYLPNIPDDDLAKLLNTVVGMGDKWPVLCAWLKESLAREIERQSERGE